MSPNILITGSHRSGSTWIGRVLESSREIDYVHEPFNLHNTHEYKTPLKYWFEYVGNDELRKQEFAKYIDYYMRGNLKCLLDRITGNKSRKTPKILLSEFKKFRKRNMRKVVKDPIAFFSADYFYNTLNYQILVAIRHPAAFAESLKNKNWTHNFNHFLKQEKMMDEIISKFRPQIENFVNSDKKRNDILEQAILLWNIIHARILYYKENYIDWMYVKHEDLSLNPLTEFQKIFGHFDISFNDSAKNFIVSTTSGNKTKSETRDSKKNITKWTYKLSKEEISRIHQGTIAIAGHFYTDKEWFGTV